MRKATRAGSGAAAPSPAAASWMATAQSTASTALANSTRAPSPIRLTIRPPCAATRGSKRSAQSARSAASVAASSSPISRE